MPGRDCVCDECGHNNFARRKTCQNCDDNGNNGGWKERDEDRQENSRQEQDDNRRQERDGNRQKNNVIGSIGSVMTAGISIGRTRS